jgi:hypothetical protein
MLVISGAILAVCAILFPLSFVLDPREHHISFSNELHVGVSRGRIDVFNQASYGPYRGSLIGLSDGEGGIIPTLQREIAVGDRLGIYVRYFRWNDPPWPLNVLWTVSVSLWWPIGAAGVSAIACWNYRTRRAMRERRIEPSAAEVELQ